MRHGEKGDETTREWREQREKSGWTAAIEQIRCFSNITRDRRRDRSIGVVEVGGKRREEEGDEGIYFSLFSFVTLF